MTATNICSNFCSFRSSPPKSLVNFIIQAPIHPIFGGDVLMRLMLLFYNDQLEIFG